MFYYKIDKSIEDDFIRVCVYEGADLLGNTQSMVINADKEMMRRAIEGLIPLISIRQPNVKELSKYLSVVLSVITHYHIGQDVR